MIIITTQITREVQINEDTFLEYCERKGLEPQEVLQMVREGELNLDHLSYMTYETEDSIDVQKIK